MIEADKRKAIYKIHLEGMSERDMSRRLKVSRNTVRSIIKQAGVMPKTVRRDKICLDPELLSRLYAECEGWAERVHERLMEEEGLQVTYPTLTRRLRELGIGQTPKPRCDRVPDEPGAEMQHDTTVCRILLADKRVRFIASMLYLRYSKRRYLKFYRVFNRFAMQCFFHEALVFWGYAARNCIIDNTNLARLRGTGREAVIVPEMELFAKKYGFVFRCHEKGHANRKAGEERSFWTMDTNFLPGRHFQDDADLNRQAGEWSTVRLDNRPQGKAGLIPALAFEHESAYLVKLPPHITAPYLVLKRETDQYGYISFNGNYYWVPGTKREEVTVLRYSDRLDLFQGREHLLEYALPAPEVKNKAFSPEGMPQPRYQPHHRKRPTQEEEKRLRAMGEVVNLYLDLALKDKDGIPRHRFIRELFALSLKMTAALFIKTVERARRYQITDLKTFSRIAWLYLNHDPQALPSAEVDEGLYEREAYQEGRLTSAPDFSPYDKMLEEQDDD